jgi:hypothetical protein
MFYATELWIKNISNLCSRVACLPAFSQQVENIFCLITLSFALCSVVKQTTSKVFTPVPEVMSGEDRGFLYLSLSLGRLGFSWPSTAVVMVFLFTWVRIQLGVVWVSDLNHVLLLCTTSPSLWYSYSCNFTWVTFWSIWDFPISLLTTWSRNHNYFCSSVNPQHLAQDSVTC